MSVERMALRARRAMVLWRLVGATVSVPAHAMTGLISALTALLRTIERVFDDFERAIFYMELDAARRYRALTGIDLGIAAGENDRYAGLDPELTEKHREERLAVFESTDDDEDE